MGWQICLTTVLYTAEIYSWVSIIQMEFQTCALSEQFFACSTNLKQGAGKKGCVRLISVLFLMKGEAQSYEKQQPEAPPS